MHLTITQKADTVGTFRFVFVRAMEFLAGWVPTSPELEVKVLFGRHIWLLAQHADWLGRRAVELRAKLHYERCPAGAYADAFGSVRSIASSADRVSVFYDTLLPDLRARLSAHMAAVDPLLDSPTVDIIGRILADFDRMGRDARATTAERPDVLGQQPSPLASTMQATLGACADFVDYRESVTA
jgi:hypothetical protein